MDADKAAAQPKADAQPPVETPAENKETSSPSAAQDSAKAPTTVTAPDGEAAESSTAPLSKDVAAKESATAAETEAATETKSKKPAEDEDSEMKDAIEAPVAATTETSTVPLKAADEADASTVVPVTPSADKSKGRRKSTVGTDSKKKLNRKNSKARITHMDAQPGDYFFVKLKGYPPWPAVVCDEDMLPDSLLKSRPVTAARQDGTYREDFADGGKRAADRTFPVMYLETNEFGWVPNTDLHDLDPAGVVDLISDKMRKDLQEAHHLASHSHPLEHWKDELHAFQNQLIEKENAATAASAKKNKKAKAVSEEEEEEDVDMVDAIDEEKPAKEKKTKKRKAEEEAATPQRSESVKKPKIKITSNSTPKAVNGSTPKGTKPSEPKAAKAKAKKEGKTEDKKAEKEVQVPKEPELSPEERHQRKEKEVLFLRHKLQKGLLTRDQEPKEDEMKLMSDYVTKLEGFKDLEVSIIRATKINKVLKGILKLANIPKEEDFHFKPRSQALLDEWNKLLAVEDGAPATTATVATNGVNGKSPAASKETTPKEKVDAPNGVSKNDETKDSPKGEGKSDAKADEAESIKEDSEKPAADTTAAVPEAVDAAA